MWLCSPSCGGSATPAAHLAGRSLVRIEQHPEGAILLGALPTGDGGCTSVGGSAACTCACFCPGRRSRQRRKAWGPTRPHLRMHTYRSSGEHCRPRASVAHRGRGWCATCAGRHAWEAWVHSGTVPAEAQRPTFRMVTRSGSRYPALRMGSPGSTAWSTTPAGRMVAARHCWLAACGGRPACPELQRSGAHPA